MTRQKRRPSPFGKTLQSFMGAKGVGVRDAARIAGVSPSTISDWRAGVVPDNHEAVAKLAEFFGTSLAFMLLGRHEAHLATSPRSVTELFDDAGIIFDGFAKITIQRMVPKTMKGK